MSLVDVLPRTNDTGPLDVLIVEDEALVAWLLEDALIYFGHRPAGVAETMEEALSLADRRRPDLALCDLRLADGDDGAAVAEALARRGIPCLFVSVNRPARAVHGLVMGWIKKPFRIDTIGEAARAVHRRACGLAMGAIPAGLTLFPERRDAAGAS